MADRPPRPGLRGDGRLARLLVELRALWPEVPLSLLALSGDGRRGAVERLAEQGIELVAGPADWEGWLAARRLLFSLVILHGPLAARRLGPLARTTQPQARWLADGPALASGGEADPTLTAAAGVVPLDLVLPVEPVGPRGPGAVEREGALVLASLLEGRGAPDEDALVLLAESVLPRVREHQPGIRLRVRGEDATRGQYARAAAEGLELLPAGADVEAELARARVVVSARRAGPPAVVPVLAAAEAGVPVLATPPTALPLSLGPCASVDAEPWRLADRIRALAGDAEAWDAARAELACWAGGRTPEGYREALVVAMTRTGLAPPRRALLLAPALPLADAARTAAGGRRWVSDGVADRGPGATPLALSDQVQTAGLRPTAGPAEAARYPTYHDWREARIADAGARRRALAEMEGFRWRPLISVVTPVYNTDPTVLAQMIASVRAQWYPHWQLCLADDASTLTSTRRILYREARFDPRLRVMRRAENGRISRASNDALAMAEGEFVALLDHDDALDPSALFEVVRLLNRCPELDFVYSDEEKIDERGVRSSPAHKPSFAPDLLTAGNYMCHLSVYRRAVVEAVGGFRPDYDGGQDLDLVLRVVEHTDRIGHIAKPLYAWRMVAGSVASTDAAKPYAYPAGRRAVEDALRRRGQAARVEELSDRGTYRVHYEIVGSPRVEVAVPAPSEPHQLTRFLAELRERTAMPPHAMSVLDGAWRSDHDAEALERLDTRLRRHPGAGFARMVNRLLEGTGADLVVIVDPRVRVHDTRWLHELVQHAQRAEVGGVGAQLHHPNGHHGAERVFPRSGLGDGWRETGFLWAVASNHHRVLRNASAHGAACLMLRPAVALEVGGLDEGLDDPVLACVDLCLRIRRRGYEIVSTPYALLVHPALARGDTPRTPAETALLRRRWGLERGWSDPYHNPNYRSVETVLHVPEAAPS